MTKSAVSKLNILSNKCSEVFPEKPHDGMTNVFQIEVMKLLKANGVEILRVLKKNKGDVQEIEKLAKVGSITSANAQPVIENLRKVSLKSESIPEAQRIP